MTRVGPKENYLINAALAYAINIAEASTCVRAHVGCVLLNPEFTQVLGIGYNGEPKGMANKCRGDVNVPGSCVNCIHAEVNALLKSPPGPKWAVVSIPPCLHCASCLINADVQAVVYGAKSHRPVNDGIALLDEAGIPHGTPDTFHFEVDEQIEVEYPISGFAQDLSEVDWDAVKSVKSKFS